MPLSEKQKGFTLIELLVVVAIIGLLASIVLASLNSARTKGRDARRIADMKDIQTALELYYSNQNKYPIAASSVSVGTGAAALTSDGDMSTVPGDPLGGTNYYSYITDAGGSKYCLSTHLEGTVPTGSITNCTATNSLTNVAQGTTGALNYSVNP
jgi:prepilin-type N-terminal cleavage/methylation domain-containing protein